jgi:3-dehydroquinate dehydratase-2
MLTGPDVRSPELVEIESRCEILARELAFDLAFAQTDDEAQLIGWVHDAVDQNAAVIINPGPSSIHSLPLLDALRDVRQKVIEIHLDNVGALTGRSMAWGFIAGFGPAVYEMALHALA